MRRYRRILLLVVLPLVALIAGLTFYLNGGRYVTTDDAYVGAQKVLITPDISGKIIKRRGEGRPAGRDRRRPVRDRSGAVPAGAWRRRSAKLDDAKTSHDNLVANVKLYGQTIELVKQGIELKQRDVDRKTALVKSNFGSQLDLDNSATALVTAQAQLQLVKQQQIAPRSTSCSAIPICRSSSSRPTCRPRRRSTRPSAISISPRCARRWPASPPRSSRSSSAASSWRARRCSASSTPRSPGSTPIRRNPTSPMSRSASPSRIDVDAFPDHVFKGTVGSLSARHRRAIRDPAAAERHRQFRQGGAARAGADLFRQQRQVSCRKLKAGMSAYTIDRHRPSPLARRPCSASSPAAANQDRTSRHDRRRPQHPSPFPACAGTW